MIQKTRLSPTGPISKTVVVNSFRVYRFRDYVSGLKLSATELQRL